MTKKDIMFIRQLVLDEVKANFDAEYLKEDAVFTIVKETFESLITSAKAEEKETKIKLVIGHWYKINDRGRDHIVQYMGRQKGFQCCVCEKGNNAHTFNCWYAPDGGYETWGFGIEHLPTIVEDLGESEEPMMDR